MGRIIMVIIVHYISLMVVGAMRSTEIVKSNQIIEIVKSLRELCNSLLLFFLSSYYCLSSRPIILLLSSYYCLSSRPIIVSPLVLLLSLFSSYSFPFDTSPHPLDGSSLYVSSCTLRDNSYNLSAVILGM